MSDYDADVQYGVLPVSEPASPVPTSGLGSDSQGQGAMNQVARCV